MKIEMVLSLVIAVSTVLYTLINLLMWVESRATRRQKTAPHIVAFLKTTEDHMTLSLRIKNIGEGFAKNVTVKVLKDYKQFGKEHLLLSELGIVKRGFNSFPPQYELTYYLDSAIDLDERGDEEVVLELNYEGIGKTKFAEVFVLPFNQLLGQNYSNPPESYIGRISYYLKQISSALRKLNDHRSER